MKKTIIILTHVMFDNSPYCSYVHNHAVELKDEGYNVIVFALLSWFPFISIFHKNRKKFYREYCGIKVIDGITVIYKKRLSFSNLLYNSKINLNGIFYYLTVKKEFKRILKNNYVVLVDAHTFKVEGCAAYLLKKKFNIKTFLTCHGSSLEYNFHTKNGILQIKKYTSLIDKVICVSDKIKNKLNELNVNNCSVIYNGINFYDKPIRNNNNHNIITVGSLTSDKNIDVVIKSFKEVYKNFSDAKLLIVGEGQLKSDLLNLVKEYNLENVITFYGQVPNKKVYELLSNSNIFVLPSAPEGFGITYVEAMYNGCIPIGTIGEGIDGFIKNGQNGFLVYVDENDIIEKINYIFNNNCEIIRKNCINDSKRLNWNKNAKEYIKIMEEV